MYTVQVFLYSEIVFFFLSTFVLFETSNIEQIQLVDLDLLSIYFLSNTPGSFLPVYPGLLNRNTRVYRQERPGCIMN